MCGYDFAPFRVPQKLADLVGDLFEFHCPARLLPELVDDVEAKFETISSGKYPLSRSLFFYIKNDHLRAVPGLYEYVKLFMDEKMIGTTGYLKRLGLVPLPDHLREASRQRVLKLTPLTLKAGKLDTLEDYAQASGFAAK